MSFKNRKLVYDRLVKDGRFNSIPPTLVKEFGDPRPSAKEPVKIPIIVKKKLVKK